jgi:hypothetical protein
MSQTEPNDPPPQEDPTHDVPVFPEHDPPPGHESPPIKASGQPRPGVFQAGPLVPRTGFGPRASPLVLKAREGDEGGPPNPGTPSKGKDEGHDVDEDDLDPKTPHSPPDVGKGGVLFDENEVVS